MNAYNANDLTVEQRVENVVFTRSAEAFDIKESKGTHLTKLVYRLIEEGEEGEQPSAYIFGFTEKFEVYLTVYFDDEKYLKDIEGIFDSLVCE